MRALALWPATWLGCLVAGLWCVVGGLGEVGLRGGVARRACSSLRKRCADPSVSRGMANTSGQRDFELPLESHTCPRPQAPAPATATASNTARTPTHTHMPCAPCKPTGPHSPNIHAPTPTPTRATPPSILTQSLSIQGPQSREHRVVQHRGVHEHDCRNEQ